MEVPSPVVSEKIAIAIKGGKEKALLQGYPWVFANQLHQPKSRPPAGAIVAVTDKDGKPLARGFYHPDSLIAVRVLTFNQNETIDDDWFRSRLQRCIDFRQSVYGDSTHYRLVYGESDDLPGLVIDRYGEVLTWSCLCYGIEQHRDMILDFLTDKLGVTAVVERNDNHLRDKDSLPQASGVIRGTLPSAVIIEEDGVRFDIDVATGPKTGFFIDHRENRAAFRRFADGRRVLDVFSADGGFGLGAAKNGASSVTLIDSSASAVARVIANARLNDLGERVTAEKHDALPFLTAQVARGERYDLIALDPPAFAKGRRHIDAAKRAYQSININAFQLLNPGGILATSSCSQAIPEDDFYKTCIYSAKRAGVRVRLIHRGGQSADHPILPAMPETGYLKFFVFQRM